MNHLVEFLSSYGWEATGALLVILMLWWVAGRDDRRKKEYEQELARKQDHERHCQTLKEWVGWDAR